jgi:hypothetical protein
VTPTAVGAELSDVDAELALPEELAVAAVSFWLALAGADGSLLLQAATYPSTNPVPRIAQVPNCFFVSRDIKRPPQLLF